MNMAALLFFRLLLIVLGLAFVITQVLAPLLTGTILFPMFRKSRTALLAEKQEVTAQLDDTELESTVVSLKQKLAERQAALHPTSVETAPTQPEQKS
jgi:fatty acid desaturase